MEGVYDNFCLIMATLCLNLSEAKLYECVQGIIYLTLFFPQPWSLIWGNKSSASGTIHKRTGPWEAYRHFCIVKYYSKSWKFLWKQPWSKKELSRDLGGESQLRWCLITGSFCKVHFKIIKCFNFLTESLFYSLS